MTNLNTQKQLERLDRELNRLEQACYDMDELSISDHSYNACIIAHHMFDFFFKELKHTNDFESWRSSIVKKNTSLQIIHDVCTASKHFTVSKPQYQRKTGEINEVRTTACYSGALLDEDALKEYAFMEPKVGFNQNLRTHLRSVRNFWANKFLNLTT